MSIKTTITITTETQEIVLPEDEAREVLEVLSRLFSEKKGYPAAAPTGPTWRDLRPPWGPMERRPFEERFPRPSHPAGPMQPVFPGVKQGGEIKVSSNDKATRIDYDTVAAP